MNAPDLPVIASAVLAAGHDGQAELVVEVRYPNGASGRLAVDHGALTRALAGSGLRHADELVGRPWTVLLAPSYPARSPDPSSSPSPLEEPCST